MKRSEFNARIAHVHKIRNQQRAVRNKISALNGPPTYIRQMAGESVRKARFNAMGDILFNNRGDKTAYESAAVAAQDIDISTVNTTTTPNLTDDPVRGGLNDSWSISGEVSSPTPKNANLFLAAENKILQRENEGEVFSDRDAAIHAQYKADFIVQFGPSSQPFEESTMRVSHLQDNEDPQRLAGIQQISEIQDAIVKLEKTLVKYNEQIGEQETEYYAKVEALNTAQQNLEWADNLVSTGVIDESERSGLELAVSTAQAEVQAIDVLLNGGSGAQGLRSLAMDVRRGIAALQRQRATVSASLGIDPAKISQLTRDAAVSGARKGTLGGGALGLGTGIIATLGLIWLFRKTTPSTRRGRGRNPIDIFS